MIHIERRTSSSITFTFAFWISCAMACGSTSKIARVVDGDESTLTDCTNIQKVTGNGADVKAAKSDARQRAAGLGATHIRWIVPCCTSVEGEAYRCDLPE